MSSRTISPETNSSDVARPPAASVKNAGLEPVARWNPTPVLTPRERDVVRGIIAGRTNKEMARELGLKEQGIKNVLSAVYQKCHVRSRLELAMFALRHHFPEN